jgi:chromosome segregation ATPase
MENPWEVVKLVLTGGAGFGASQLYDTYIRGKKDKKDSESEALRAANESRDRDLSLIRDQDEAERAFRDELRGEISSLRTRISTLEQELKTSTERYVELLHEHTILKSNYAIAQQQIDTLKSDLKRLKDDKNDMDSSGIIGSA